MLSGETDRTICRKIQRGEYSAVAVAAHHGQGGKQYMVDITNLPEDAQIRYIAQMEGGSLGEADIVSYQARYGNEGISAVLSWSARSLNVTGGAILPTGRTRLQRGSASRCARFIVGGTHMMRGALLGLWIKSSSRIRVSRNPCACLRRTL